MHIPFVKRIDRYLFNKFLGTFIFSIVLLIGIGVVFDYNENIDKFTTQHAPWRAIILDYYANFVPYYANTLCSLFVFLSVIFFTSKLAGNSEIIAMTSAGISLRRLLLPYMVCATLIAGTSFYLTSEIIPKGSIKRLQFENMYKKSANRKNPTYAEKVQLQVDSGVIAYMQSFDGVSKTGFQFHLDKFENKRLVSHLTASTAQYDTLSDVRYHWKLNNVDIRQMRGNREILTHHPSLDSIIMMEPSDFLFIRDQQETLTNAQLLDYIQKQQTRGSANLTVFQVEYYRRYAAIMAAYIMTIIGFSISCRRRKGGMGASIGMGILIGVVYIVLQSFSTTFSTNMGFSPVIAAWLPNIIYTFIAIYFLSKARA